MSLTKQQTPPPSINFFFTFIEKKRWNARPSAPLALSPSLSRCSLFQSPRSVPLYKPPKTSSFWHTPSLSSRERRLFVLFLFLVRARVAGDCCSPSAQTVSRWRVSVVVERRETSAEIRGLLLYYYKHNTYTPIWQLCPLYNRTQLPVAEMYKNATLGRSFFF